jgi:hypothetical protein
LSADSGHERGRSKPAAWRLGSWGLVWVVLLLSLPAISQTGEKQLWPRKIVGLVTMVEPSRVTIRGAKEGEITVQTVEDFTEKVAVGSQVTAWYFPKEKVNVLQWLEYPLENSFVSPGQFRSQVKKIIILPDDGVGGADGLFTAMGTFLESRLGWFVAPHILAEEIRRRARKSNSTLDVIDPSTGNVDLAAYVQTHRDLIRELASETRVDAVLEANVELVQVEFRYQMAVWDGVRQPVSSKVSRTLAVLSPLPVEGHAPAATVVLKLWDAQGNLLWSNRRGFAVLALQEGIRNKFRDRPIPEVLKDTGSVERWFADAFGSWLPAESGARSSAAKQ